MKLVSKQEEHMEIDTSFIERRNAAVVKANEFTDELTRSNIRWSAREMGQGIEVKILRPSWQGMSVSYRIFPY